MQSFAELIGRVSEIARQARSRDEFRQHALSCVAERVGTEGVAICHVPPGGHRAPDWLHVLGGEAVPSPFTVAYLEEFSPQETQGARRPTAWRDTEVISPPRRERLGLYREYLAQWKVSTFAGRCWDDLDGARVMSLFPQGAIDATRFFRRAKAALDAVFPILALGERLHNPDGQTWAAEAALRDWAHEHALTPGELKVIGLVERGLTNPEIAVLLSLSPNTVRNRLASVFRKLDVSRRAELAYQLGVARVSFTHSPVATARRTPPLLPSRSIGTSRR